MSFHVTLESHQQCQHDSQTVVSSNPVKYYAIKMTVSLNAIASVSNVMRIYLHQRLIVSYPGVVQSQAHTASVYCWKVFSLLSYDSMFHVSIFTVSSMVVVSESRHSEDTSCLNVIRTMCLAFIIHLLYVIIVQMHFGFCCSLCSCC